MSRTAMNTRVLGRTGMRVPVIGVGAWQFGGEWGREFTQAEVDAILDAAFECGMTLIDTAECYGDHLSERLIGDYLSRRNRPDWLVATKFGHQFHGFMDRTWQSGPDAVRGQLEDSLRALRVETLDLYQFHSGSNAAFEHDALWDMLDGAKRAGKIRHLGVSIGNRPENDVQAGRALARGAEALQVVYNRMDRRAETVVFPLAERDRLGVLARVPLASGLLAGRYVPGHTFTGRDVRAKWPEEVVQRRLREARRILCDEAPPDVAPAAWAMAWCLRDPRVSTVIPGCKSPDQVRANARASDVLTDG